MALAIVASIVVGIISAAAAGTARWNRESVATVAKLATSTVTAAHYRAAALVSVAPPGFVWDARIGMMPLVSASVRDAYVGSRGLMQASIFGLYTLADQAGKPELNAGALQRDLGEAIWFPTALLPSSTVTWSSLDDQSARVSLRDGDTSVSLLSSSTNVAWRFASPAEARRMAAPIPCSRGRSNAMTTPNATA